MARGALVVVRLFALLQSLPLPTSPGLLLRTQTFDLSFRILRSLDSKTFRAPGSISALRCWCHHLRLSFKHDAKNARAGQAALLTLGANGNWIH